MVDLSPPRAEELGRRRASAGPTEADGRRDSPCVAAVSPAGPGSEYGVCMPDREERPDAFERPVVWLGVEEVAILYANAFQSQIDSQTLDSIVLTIGQMTQPAISGATEEERRRQAETVAYVHVKPVVRVGLTEARVRDLQAILGASLRQLEQARSMRPQGPRT